MNAGSSQTVSINAAALNGFSAAISLSFSGLPAGVTASPATFTIAGGGSQAVTLTAASSAAPIATQTVTVTGSSGSLSHTATFTFSVLGPPSFTLSVSPTSLAMDQNTTQTVTLTAAGVNGFTGIVSGTISGLPAGFTISSPTFSLYAGSSTTLNITASASASGAGEVTFAGTSGSLSASASLNLSVTTAPDFSLQSGIYTAAAVYAGGSDTITVGATGYNGFTAPITVTLSGLPTGVTASPSTFTILPGATQNVVFTAALSAPPNSNATITLKGTSGSITHSTSFSFLVLALTFSIQANPPTITVPAGSSSSTTVYASGIQGATAGSIAVTVSGLPSGVSSPSSFSMPASAASQTVFFNAASGSTGASGTVTFTATYGPYTSTVTLSLKVSAPQSITSVPLTSKTRYLRTDSTADYSGVPPPNWTVYHQPTARFFVSDYGLGRVNVIDSTTEKIVTYLQIPGAFGMDLAPDGSVLYVGTISGDLYVVDPVHLSVVTRYPSATISPYGFPANAVYALSNGKLLLLRYFVVSGFSFVDGNGPLALWNPADNSIVEFGEFQGTIPTAPTCFAGFEFGLLTNSRTRFLITPVITAEGSSVLCSLDPNAGTFVYSPVLASADGSSLSTLAVSPDGTTVAAFDGTNVYVLDAATLTLKSQFSPASSQLVFLYPSMVIGPDNKTLYLQGGLNYDFIEAYDLTTGKATGWLPDLQLQETFAEAASSSPYLQAISSNGLIAGVLDQGVGLIDTTALHPMPLGTAFGPATPFVTVGPVSGGTDTSWWQSDFVTSLSVPLGSIYFGANAATDISSSSQETETLFATSPAGTAGPVDLMTLTTDGGEQLIPDGFSYGPWSLEIPTSYATAEGGGPGSLYGYGLGPVSQVQTGTLPAAPAGLSVQVGGNAATLTGFNPDAYNAADYTSIPFPLTGIEFTVPPGAAGTSADLTVTNGSGTSTVKNAIAYLPPVTKFSLPDSTLVDGVYDAKRDLYYFTDTNQVQVFSRTESKWLAPIPIPLPAGAYAAQRLFGIALSPDDSKIAVADFGAIAVYLIDSDSHAIQSFPLASQIFEPIVESPTGVAVTDSGQIYFAASDEDGDGAPYIVQVDSASGKIVQTWEQSEGPAAGRLPLSADGTRLYFNNAGLIGYLDLADGTLSYSTEIGALAEASSGSYEIALSAGQTRLFADQYVTDSQLDLLGLMSLNYRELPDANYVYGAALSPDGNLVFVPGTQSIDLFDGRLGTFRGRVSLPVQLSSNFRALVADGQDDVFVAITGTGNGIGIVDLSQVQEPTPIGYIKTSPFDFAAGTQLARSPVTSVRPRGYAWPAPNSLSPPAAGVAAHWTRPRRRLPQPATGRLVGSHKIRRP